MKMVSCKVMTIENQQGYHGIGGFQGGVRVYWGWQGVKVVRGQKGYR